MKRALILLLWVEVLIFLLIQVSFALCYFFGGGAPFLPENLAAAVSYAAGLLCIPLFMLNTVFALRFLYLALRKPDEQQLASCWIDVLNLLFVTVVSLIVFNEFVSATTPRFIYDLM